MAGFIDLTGKKFGRLTVVSLKQKASRIDGKQKPTKWLCLCDCGKEKAVNPSNLKSGFTQSCGCLQKERASNASPLKTHGKSNKAEYNSWHSMVQRCHNKNNPNYTHYGAKGVFVCHEWLFDFERFHSDMGDKPSKKHTIDRIDVTQGYSASNCKWSSKDEQANNKRNTKFLELDDKRLSISQWAKEIDLNPATIRMRLRNGWSVSEALRTEKHKPIKTSRQKLKSEQD